MKSKLLAMGYKPVEIKVTGVDEPVYIREMSYKGVLAVAKCINPTERMIIMTIYSLCDEKGNLVFTEEDKDEVSTIPYGVISEISYEASKLTKFDDNRTVK
ncbi:hypothetical protein KGV31_002170 [Vibrio parahaemolyticus]|nr:hypothetical protein [Vibrio parahaemolyticus]EHU0344313.1 hypothetical protein [Vibrio parahaemolyticus]EHU0354347.1 hypothetical protein [Vibrio parahaemolyticus]